VQLNNHNFGPRFGVAYALNEKTILRGGYGYYYSLLERFGSENQLGLNPPFLINKIPAVAGNSKTPILVVQNGFPLGFVDPASVTLSQLQAFHIRAVNPHQPAPNVQQWSVGFQRELPMHFTADVNYVGTKSTHLDVLNDLNQPTFNHGVTTNISPFPNFGYIEYQNSIGYGNYNGLEATLSRRSTNGFSFRAAYTYSHSLDNAPQELENNSGAPPEGRNYSGWYGRSDFDVPQRVSFNYVYELPFGKGKALPAKACSATCWGASAPRACIRSTTGVPSPSTAAGFRACSIHTVPPCDHQPDWYAGDRRQPGLLVLRGKER